MAIQSCLNGSARTIKEAIERAQQAESLGFEAIFLPTAT